MKKLLITICGRAGSKGFKNKNLKTFCGHPLVYYSLAAAGLFCDARPDVQVDLCLNTDSEALAKLVAENTPRWAICPAARNWGATGCPRWPSSRTALPAWRRKTAPTTL